MRRTIIRDCRVWDGSGKAAFPADLLIEGGRIRAVARNRGQLDAADAEVIEAGGITLQAEKDARPQRNHESAHSGSVRTGSGRKENFNA